MNPDLTNAKSTLSAESLTCVLCRDDKVFKSSEKGISPLIKWLESGDDFKGFSAADKVVGKADDELCDKYFNDKNVENIYACTDPSGGYHYIITEVDLEKVMVLFNPNEKMIEHIKNLNRDKKFLV